MLLGAREAVAADGVAHHEVDGAIILARHLNWDPLGDLGLAALAVAVFGHEPGLRLREATRPRAALQSRDPAFVRARDLGHAALPNARLVNLQDAHRFRGRDYS